MTEEDSFIGVQTDPACECDEIRSKHTHRYDLIEQVGEGGMSRVYRAIDLDPPRAYVQRTKAPRIVAIKYLNPELVQDKHGRVLIERFKREARIANEINHPNIVRVLNIGTDQAGRPYLAMEFVDGAFTISHLIAEAKMNGVPRDPESGKIVGSLIAPATLVPILLQSCSALGELHKRCYIHRDVKPDNFLIHGTQTMLTDFGIIKLEDDDKEKLVTKLTQEGTVLGTPYYMAPEQIVPAKLNPDTEEVWSVGPWTDIWAFGVMAYELVTGELPFFHEKMVPVMTFIVDDNKQPNPIDDYVVDLDPELRHLIERCMDKRPWERPQSMKEVRKLVRAVQASVFGSEDDDAQDSDRPPGIKPSATRKPSPVPAKPAPPPTKGLVGSVAATFLILGILGALIFLMVRKESDGALESQPSASPIAAATNRGEPLDPISVGTTATDAPARSTKREPNPGPQRGEAAFTWYQEGMKSFRQGNCSNAERLLNRVVGRYPAFPPPLKVLATCALKAGRRDEARKYAQRYDAFETSDPLSPDVQALLSP